jgi:hypothetical protein
MYSEKKKKRQKDWLVVLFRKENFDENLQRHPLYTFKKTYDGVVVLAFHGRESEITKLCLDLQCIDAALPFSERNVLMQIDKEGIVHWES